MKPKKYYILELKESGERFAFDTIKERNKKLKEIKAFDKRNGIVGESYEVYTSTEKW